MSTSDRSHHRSPHPVLPPLGGGRDACPEHRFTPTALFIVGSLLVWMANFVVVYVIGALACARGFADIQILGLPIVSVATAASSLVAAIVTVVLLRKGTIALRDRHASEQSRFIGFVALMTSVLALIALVLVALPPLLVVACAQA